MSFKFKKNIAFFILLLSMFLLSQKDVLSQYDSSARYIKVFTGHFNFDILQDTLFAKTDSLGLFLFPGYINWGLDTSGGAAQLSRTYFQYPNFEHTRGSFFVDKMNQDTLNDIVLLMDSLYIDTISVDTIIIERHIAKRLIIFGQNKIDSVPVINIAQVDTAQNSPFFVRNFRLGMGLSEPAVRDFSGTISYIFTPIDLDVNSSGEEPPEIFTTNVEDFNKYKTDLVIIPNPAEHSFRVNFINCPEGMYNIKLITLESQIICEQNVDVKGAEFKSQFISLKDVPSGKYSVVAQKKGIAPIVRTLIVVH